MKVKILIIFLLISNVVISQNTIRGIITYNASFNIKSINLNRIGKEKKTTKEVNEKVVEILKGTTDQLYSLSFVGNKSLFEKENEMENEGNSKINLTEILAGNGKFYVDNETDVVLEQKDFMGDVFIIKNSPINWELTQDTKEISGYICFKATTIKIIENKKGVFERPVIAWYTPKISANFGPKGYNGLPGLILELVDGKINFKVIKIELNTSESIKIKKPTKGKKVTLEEYKAITKDVAKGFMGRD